MAILLFAGGGSANDAVQWVLSAIAWNPPADVVIATGSRRMIDDREEGLGAVVHYLRSRQIQTKVIAPPESAIGAWLTVRATEWKPAAIAGQVQRIEKVWLPRTLAEAGSIVAINRVGANEEALVLGLWAKYAHPRQRTGARLSDARDGLAAEIARAVKPDLILLVGSVNGIDYVIASNDQIAAELAGIAARQLSATDIGERVGPWEEPLVQRATEFELGVRLPRDIEPSWIWLGSDHTGPSARFMGFVEEVCARIGVHFEG